MTEEELKSIFQQCRTKEELYQKIIEWGKTLPPFDPAWKIEANRVLGCQSLMYLHTEVREGKLFFYADSDALISRGLAAILITLYQDKEVEYLLKTRPTVIDSLGMMDVLTPGRANGFASLYEKMRQQGFETLFRHKEGTKPSLPKISIVNTKSE